jgi:hypothetical protein
VLTLALMGLAGFGGYTYFKRTVLDALVANHQRELSTERSRSNDLKSKLAVSESTQTRLEAELAAAKKDATEKAESATSQEAEVTKQGAKIKQLVEYKKKIHSSIQQYAKQRLLERFGPDPHRVEIQLAYDPASNVFNTEGGDRIVIEMAPSEEMPYTVYWFLSQVDRGLFNLTSFHRNAHHGRSLCIPIRSVGSRSVFSESFLTILFLFFPSSLVVQAGYVIALSQPFLWLTNFFLANIILSLFLGPTGLPRTL